MNDWDVDPVDLDAELRPPDVNAPGGAVGPGTVSRPTVAVSRGPVGRADEVGSPGPGFFDKAKNPS